MLNTTFSADHSGLDAALDIIRIEVDPASNEATISNLLEPANTMTDSILDPSDTGTLPVSDPAALRSGVTDIQAIAAAFGKIQAEFSFHCNDNDGEGGGNGACGINTSFFDDDFINNGTGNAPIVSGTTEIIAGTSGAVKATVYLGTPVGAAPGYVQVWDEAGSFFQGDYKAFGTGLGEINPALFAAGDSVRYKVYTEALDISNPAAPQIAAGATPVATYSDPPLLFAPSTTPKYPSLTATAQTAMAAFTLGNNLTLDWTFASGTRNEALLVIVSDGNANRMETWVDTLLTTPTTATIALTALSVTAATNAGLDPNATSYTLLVRIYAADALTGQAHSRDYTVQIPGPAAP